MFKDIAFGQYYPSNSIIHKLDAKIKLLETILFIIAIFFIKSYVGFMLTIATLIFIVAIAKLPMISVLKSIRGILFIVLFSAILNLFLVKGDEVLVSYKSIIIYKSAVHTTIKMVLRLVLLISGASLLSLTTTPVDLADGFEGILKPLKLIKVPVRDIAMIMSIALRFIPTLFEETQIIISAQKARGASFDTGNLFKRAKALLPILIPLFVSSFRRADELAFAMDSRCYNATENRTRLKVNKIKISDILSLIFIVAFFTIILLERYYFPTIGLNIDYLIFGDLL